MAELYLVGQLSRLKPGEMARAQAAGRPLLLANVAGRIHAVDEICTHEDASLYNGCLRGDHVECPLHGSRFSVITGAPLEEPATEPLRTYAVTLRGDDILVEL